MSAGMHSQLVLLKQAERDFLEQAMADFLARGGKVYEADVSEHKSEELSNAERRKLSGAKGFWVDD